MTVDSKAHGDVSNQRHVAASPVDSAGSGSTAASSLVSPSRRIPSGAGDSPRRALTVDTGATAARRHTRERPSPAKLELQQQDVGAPAVWIAPDWASHPIIESFYGHARRARASSFDEVMCSPTSTKPTTTLGESCCGYDDRQSDDEAVNSVGGQLGGRLASLGGGAHSRHPFGSFAYSCTTDTSEEGAVTAVGMTPESPLYDRRTPLPTATGAMLLSRSADHSRSAANVFSGSGFANWNRMRRTMSNGGGLVPVPHDPHGNVSTGVLHQENPQAGGDLSQDNSPETSTSDPESPTWAASAPEPPTSSRLRGKLQDSLADIDARIEEERKRLEQAQQAAKQAANTRPATGSGVMWGLLCGARTTEASYADGLQFLREKVTIAVSTRALNQLQRHGRHIRGILQIVTAHNPDLELTERQLDSFEAADAMLANDIKYSVLQQQSELLAVSVTQRRRALAQAKFKNGTDCFEIPHVKNAMLAKLLEAVSWYRLVQRNAREESASSSVASPPTSASGSVDARGSGSGSGLQELQVEKILDVLAGEEFYSEYSELMCQPDWWAIAQAHFENLIFSSKTSRICQWMLQLSKDVAAVSREELELDEGYFSSRRPSIGGLEASGGHEHGSVKQRASWTRDPPPEQLLDFLDRLTSRVRREFDVPGEVTKSLNVFIQRTVFPRVAVLCFNQRATRDCQRKDKLWRKKCAELTGLPLENLSVSPELAAKIRSQLPSRRVRSSVTGSRSGASQRRVFFVRAIEAFSSMSSVVPCDLLDELMHGVVILHHEAALVLGTTQFSVETFFPLLAYVLLHCQLPTIHAHLHLLENFAITADNANGEESYYVYCVHAAVEYVCNTAGLCADDSSVAGHGVTNSNASAASTPASSGFTPVVPMTSTSARKDYLAAVESKTTASLGPDDSSDVAVEWSKEATLLDT